MEKREEYEASSEPNAPGLDTPPEQEEPRQEPPASALVIHFAGPGVAHVARMEAIGQVSNGQMAYLGFLLFAQALSEIGAPLFAGIAQGIVEEATKPKIETARAGFRIPPDMLRGSD